MCGGATVIRNWRQMNRIIDLSSEERSNLFEVVGNKINMHPAIVEKDFWVCYTLDYLFHRCKWKDAFVFKGGTSLSKAYNVIKRFSEDIDLILDWRLIDFEEAEPWIDRSKTQQDKFNKKMNSLAADFLAGDFICRMRDDLEGELKVMPNLHIDEADSQTVCFEYPQLFSIGYLRQEIRLEIGPIAEWTPSHERNICSYASETFPEIVEDDTSVIRTVDVERTFWEKTTILHKVANRDISKPFPPRYSRHYYDLYCLYNSDVRQRAYDNVDLLERDVEFKKKFYYAKGAGYDTAAIGTMRLMPQKDDIPKLRDDYLHMYNMLYGTIPDFEEIISAIEKLEAEVNNL